mmetsp:Transcript_9726/g.34699  ORF Transcript_9726/g.34699 Transcript_9726/m.34699 type:complete len:311 (+) Transcript_9726:539-1471(+)
MDACDVKHEDGVTPGAGVVHLSGLHRPGGASPPHQRVGGLHRVHGLPKDASNEGASTSRLWVLDGVLLGVRGAWLQEVPHGLVVDLDEAGLHLVRPALLLQALTGPDDLLNASCDDSLRVALAPKHGVCLSAPGLAVAEQAHLVPVQGGLHKLADLPEDVLLGGGLGEDLVKAKLPILGLRGERAIVGAGRGELHGHVVHVGHGGRGPGLLEGPDPAEDPDVAAELLNLVVQLAADVLGLQQLSLDDSDPRLPVLDLKLETIDVALQSEDLLPGLLHGLRGIADLLHLLLLILVLGLLEREHLGLNDLKL